jgi:hypothetical protein
MGQNFSLTVDRGYTRYINNRGQRAYLNTSEIRALYIGGLPNDLKSRALQLWHIREATSFQGKKNMKKFFFCFLKKIFLKVVFMDFISMMIQ